MAINWVGLAGQGLDYLTTKEDLEDAQHDIEQGFKTGEANIKKYGEPYHEFGLDHMGGYNELGEFDFTEEDLYDDPSYQFRMDQGMDNTMRQNAAAKMAGTGKTLVDLTKYSQGLASTEYAAAHGRALAEYDANRAYHQFGVQTGADVGLQMGTNLADLAIGKGGALADLHITESKEESNQISSALANLTGGDAGVIGGVVNEAISRFGSATSKAAMDWISGKTGISPSSIGDAIGGIFAGGSGAGATSVAMTGAGGYGTGVGAMTGGLTGEGAMGITSMGEGFGGSFSAGLAEGGTTATGAGSAGAAGFGTWAASVAGGAAVLAGIAMLNTALGGKVQIGKTLSRLSKAEDPLGMILDNKKLDFNDMGGLYSRDDARIVGGQSATSTQMMNGSRGMLSSMIIGSMSPEEAKHMRMRDDIGDHVSNMLQALNLGLTPRKKHTGDNVPMPIEGLTKLFPGMAKELQAYQAATNEYQRLANYNATSDDSFINTQNSISFQNEALAEKVRLQQLVQSRIRQKMQQWERKRNIAGELEGI